MVKIIDYKVRTNEETGEQFCTLTLSGGIEIVRSKNTGKQYATIKKCSIPASFEESICKSLVGTSLTGRIEKVPCEEYEIVDKKTGEMIALNFTYNYIDEADTMEETILEPVALA